MHLLCATNTLALVGVLSAQIPTCTLSAQIHTASSNALTPNTAELIPTLRSLFPRGGPVQDPVLTIIGRTPLAPMLPNEWLQRERVLY